MKVFLHYLIYFFFVFVFFSCVSGKKSTDKVQNPEFSKNSYRVMFFNAENLFDTEDDPLKNDEEFTPEGSRYWSGYRYKQKLSNIYKVIVAVGEWDLPLLVGLSEVENRKVLEELLNFTPLYKSDYKIIHYESPDSRGIDVALLYRSELFKPISHKPIQVVWPKSIGTGTTRDILYACGTTNEGDTLHIFVNHWPSRWGGQMETEEKRMFVAKLLKTQTDSIFDVNPFAKIIIMGDLNDYPTDRSLLESLKTNTDFNKIKPDKLYNLSYYLQEIKKLGTHKYDGQWGILDQMIVSGALLDTTKSIFTTLDDAHVFNDDFMLEPDEKYTGKRVNRTYIGYKYHGGYSDHLPTYIDLKKK
ncbi:MAG TPA: endonuclease [Bacteroidales bacterium]|nr:endonuclease [Bacteroidales bacterium]